jgi:large subunit ribosomal protein L13
MTASVFIRQRGNQQGNSHIPSEMGVGHGCRQGLAAPILIKPPFWGSAAHVGPLKGSLMRTYTPKASEIQRDWHIIDAEGLVLGRLCTEVARILRGKHKPVFAPHMDMGDHVIIINASKIVMTSGKAETNMVYTYSGYPGGLKSESYQNLLNRKPADAIARSIGGMLPKGPLGRQMIKKLKVYPGAEHPHAAQSPKVLDLSAAKAR